MAPIGLGDELRVAFRSGGETWGFACVHREDAAVGFSEAEARVIAGLAQHVGEAMRRALVVGKAERATEPDGPGVLLIEDGSLLATTAVGERWLWELGARDERPGPLPIPVQAVIAGLKAVGTSTGAELPQPKVRVRTRSGRWAVLHASEMSVAGAQRGVAVVVEAAKPAELAPLVLLAYGLTPREAQVAQLTLKGRASKLIARELGISLNTVEDHLKAVFAKVGVASRGELTATVFSDHYAH
jgi:DNA-binding CsgD family transcriptional regulator